MSPTEMRRLRAANGGTLLPSGVTCVECAAVGWPDCGTARDLYCVASDHCSQAPPTEDQPVLW